MLIEDRFTVRTPTDRLWAFLHDVERLAPCMPGAELTETIDDRSWRGTVRVAFGPVEMTFVGTVVMEERDDAAHRARLSAKGTERRGRGAAVAVVESWLESTDDGATTVRIRSDVTITGAAAQLSRGLLPEVSRLLTKRFAECLEATVSAEEAPTAPRPVGAIGLGLRALWTKLRRWVAGLFGRADP